MQKAETARPKKDRVKTEDSSAVQERDNLSGLRTKKEGARL